MGGPWGSRESLGGDRQGPGASRGRLGPPWGGFGGALGAAWGISGAHWRTPGGHKEGLRVFAGSLLGVIGPTQNHNNKKTVVLFFAM